MDDDFETSISVPLDSDGFLRRQCPTCERELKWLGVEDETIVIPDGGFVCPYCAIQAPPGEWWTEEQIKKAQSIVMEEVVGPELDKFERQIEDLNRSMSGGLLSLSLSVERDQPEPADELTEIDDMRRVDFACHPSMPVKVLEDWTREVHCPICGTVAEST